MVNKSTKYVFFILLTSKFLFVNEMSPNETNIFKSY